MKKVFLCAVCTLFCCCVSHFLLLENETICLLDKKFPVSLLILNGDRLRFNEINKRKKIIGHNRGHHCFLSENFR